MDTPIGKQRLINQFKQCLLENGIVIWEGMTLEKCINTKGFMLYVIEEVRKLKCEESKTNKIWTPYTKFYEDLKEFRCNVLNRWHLGFYFKNPTQCTGEIPDGTHAVLLFRLYGKWSGDSVIVNNEYKRYVTPDDIITYIKRENELIERLSVKTTSTESEYSNEEISNLGFQWLTERDTLKLQITDMSKLLDYRFDFEERMEHKHVLALERADRKIKELQKEKEVLLKRMAQQTIGHDVD